MKNVGAGFSRPILRPVIAIVIALGCVMPSPARAAVTQVSSSGFLVTSEAEITAPPERVYQALVEQVGRWWDPQHTYSGDSSHLSIDARPGGCFCERLPNGGGAEHLRVVNVVPRELLRMTGALGPLQASALAGTLTWKLTRSAAGTTVTLSYAVSGFFDGGFAQIAPAVDGVLSEQVRRLKRFVETGKPTP